ncbi:MAG: AtpZ/AtpI family protein [Methyloprofundus sp.]|nr:AtpZ/AtpI family protein [Methyloprofundus sp.]
MNHKQRLQKQVDNQIKRIKKARHEQSSILAQTLYLGTLGLVLILPIIGGAYLGLWLDSMAAGYSMRWTISLLLLGLLIGAINVYLLIKQQDNADE